MAGQTVAGELYESITGQLFEIGRQLRQPNGYPFDPLQLKDALQAAIEGKFDNSHVATPNSVTINWHVVYEKLGLSKDAEPFLNDDPAQALDNETSWAVPVLKGLTPNKVVKTLRDLGVGVELFGNDLDKCVPTNDRDPKAGSYVVRFAKNIEADSENANLSANDRKGQKDTTLLERLLLELGYFLATGNHLDILCATLCSGSRHSDGLVPGVDWRPDRRGVCVGWCGPGSRRPRLRSRAVVS